MELKSHYRLGVKPEPEAVEIYRVHLAAVTAMALSGQTWLDCSEPRVLSEVQGGELDAVEAAKLLCQDEGYLDLEFMKEDGTVSERQVILSDLIRANHRVNCYNKSVGRGLMYPLFYADGAPMLIEVLKDPKGLSSEETQRLRTWLHVAAYGDKAITGNFFGKRRPTQ